MTQTTQRTSAREWGFRIALLIGSLVFTFIVLEVLVRFVMPDRQLRYKTDPQLLWYFQPGQAGTIPMSDGSESPAIHINSFGLRGPEFQDRETRVLLLGDSFTFGSGVADDETFAARLSRAFGDKGLVVNGGQPGYGVFQMEGTLKRLGDIVRPSAVVLVLWQGDVLRQPLEQTERERFLATKQKTELLKSSVLVTHLYRALERALIRVGADNMVVTVGDRSAPAGTSNAGVLQQHYTGLEKDFPRLLAIHNEARKHGRGLILVFWPKEDFATVPPGEVGLAAGMTERIEAFASQHEIPFLTMQPVMRGHSAGTLLIPRDYHPTAFAHCLAATRIARELEKHGYAFPNSITCEP